MNFFTSLSIRNKNVRGFISGSLRRQVLLLALTLFIGAGLFLVVRLPPDTVLFRSETKNALDFFRAPIDQFYISVFFSWIDFLRGREVLAPLLALIAVCALFDISRGSFPAVAFPAFVVASLHTLLFVFLLPTASPAYAFSPIVTAAFLALFVLVRVRFGREAVGDH